MLSLRQAGKALQLDPKVIKGLALGMGIRLMSISGCLFMTAEDFDRLKGRCEALSDHLRYAPA